MTVKSNKECECIFEDHIGPIFCEIKCRNNSMKNLRCNCKGFLRGSNKSHSCEISYDYYGPEMGSLAFHGPPPPHCIGQEGNTSEWSKLLKCEKFMDKNRKDYTHSCSFISTLNAFLAPGISTSTQKTSLGESVDVKRGNLSYTEPTEIFNLTASRLINSKKQTASFLDNASTHVTEGTAFTVKSKILEEKNITKIQPPRLGKSAYVKGGKYSYKVPTANNNLTTDRLIHAKEQTTGVSNDAHTDVTERTFRANTNIHEQKNVNDSINPPISSSNQSSNSNRIYDALKTPLDYSKPTGGPECGLLILGIFIIGFLSLIAYLRARKRAFRPSNFSLVSMQDDNRGKHERDTCVTFKNGATGIYN